MTAPAGFITWVQAAGSWHVRGCPLSSAFPSSAAPEKPLAANVTHSPACPQEGLWVISACITAAEMEVPAGSFSTKPSLSKIVWRPGREV